MQKFGQMKPSFQYLYASSSPIITLVLILSVWCTAPTDAAVELPANVSIPALIVFGDSIVDQGSNNNLKTLIKANFPPYGKDFIGGLPTGRFTNAKTPPDILASELGITDLLPSYLDPSLQTKDLLTGVSFASGGTGYDPQTPKIVVYSAYQILSNSITRSMYMQFAIPLPDQVEMFKEYVEKLKGLVGEERTSYILTNSIFLLVAGSDDLANTYYILGIRKLEYDVPSYADLLVASASNFIQTIYELGARRIAIYGMPPIGCLPSQRTLAGGLLRVCAEDHNQATQVYNFKLSAEIHSLSNRLPHSKMVYIDIYNPVLDVIKHPQNYGIDIVDKGCCGSGSIEVVILCNKFSETCPDRSKYLFWDSYHPTERGYQIIVDQFIKNYLNRLF